MRTAEAVPGRVYRESPSLKHREVLLLFANLISASDLTSRPDKWIPSCYNPPSFLSRHAATTDSLLSFPHTNDPVKRTANETNWNTAKFTLQARNTYLVLGRVNIHFNAHHLARKMHEGFDYGYTAMNALCVWLLEECDCERCTRDVTMSKGHCMRDVTLSKERCLRDVTVSKNRWLRDVTMSKDHCMRDVTISNERCVRDVTMHTDNCVTM